MIRRTKRFRRNFHRLSNIALWLYAGLLVALAIEGLLGWATQPVGKAESAIKAISNPPAW
ncbi:hypothetical protein M2282_005245 [Variovorax boronicumulans]|uniref:hypothetical protein n=1 Tax=Variovorax boronicumulans TaxID=436515 RepID=UPI00247640ED|nr:hypothetical protein [Variovorax boronicumulans]MDH6170075.1 hypothetical protein [Variovorax boronicumulans]